MIPQGAMVWISWLLGFVLAVGLLAVLLSSYLLGVFRRRTRSSIKNFPPPTLEGFEYTLASLSDSFLAQGRVTDFWVGADEIYPARLRAIRSAESEILFETFWMTPGQRASDFAEALMERARLGVRVWLIVDSYGTKSIPESYWQRLRAASVKVGFFNRFSWRAPLDYLDRTHRKLLLIDRRIALVGGAGVSDMWDGTPETGGDTDWLDYEVSLQGEVVSRLAGIFLQRWLDVNGQLDFSGKTIQQYPDSAPRMLVTSGEDPSYRDSAIRAMLQLAIAAADKRVWIASPYLIPDAGTRDAIAAATQRGVEIRILTMGSRTDKRFVYHTSQTLYHYLLEAGAQIYEYQPSMLHAKILLVDEHWVSLGSANFDPRSFFHNDELNLSTAEPMLVQWVERFFEAAWPDSHKIDWQDIRSRSLRERLIGRFGLLFSRQL